MQAAAQVSDPPAPGVNNNSGSKKTNPNDPIAELPDGRIILRDGRIVAPGESPSAKTPKTTRKRGMKKTDPPKLRPELEDKRPPVMSVRNQLGDREGLISSLRKRGLPANSNSGPTGDFYDTTYRKLYRERESFIREANGTVDVKIKSILIEQALELSDTLNNVRLPSTAKKNEFRQWTPLADFRRGWDPSSVGRDIEDANKIINSPDRAAAARELDRLRQKQKVAEVSAEDRDEIERDFFASGAVGRLYGKAAVELYRDEFKMYDVQYQRLLDYIKDYEKAVQRKWPNNPEIFKKPNAKPKGSGLKIPDFRVLRPNTNLQDGELEVPEIGPLPEVKGAPEAPGPIDFPGE